MEEKTRRWLDEHSATIQFDHPWVRVKIYGYPTVVRSTIEEAVLYLQQYQRIYHLGEQTGLLIHIRSNHPGGVEVMVMARESSSSLLTIGTFEEVAGMTPEGLLDAYVHALQQEKGEA